jgi:hypothetical protein
MQQQNTRLLYMSFTNTWKWNATGMFSFTLEHTHASCYAEGPLIMIPGVVRCAFCVRYAMRSVLCALFPALCVFQSSSTESLSRSCVAALVSMRCSSTRTVKQCLCQISPSPGQTAFECRDVCVHVCVCVCVFVCV